MNLTTITIHLDDNLKTEFTTFFDHRGLSLNSALQFVMRDYLQRYRIKNLDQMMNKFQLSPRERQVTLLLCKGYSNREISSKLYISIDTVNTHLKNVHKKCGTKNKILLVNLLNNLRYE